MYFAGDTPLFDSGMRSNARVKKGAYHPRNTKNLVLAGSLFSRKKGITLIYAMWGIDQFLFRVDPRGDPNRPTCPYVGSVAREEL